jgi:hypothetical protein
MPQPASHDRDLEQHQKAMPDTLCGG